MSKKNKKPSTFFKGIYNAFDKAIITPISKLVYLIYTKIKKSGGKLEKLLNKPHILIYISLLFAIGVFFLVNSKVISLVQTEAEVLVNQPVKVEYNTEAYVVEGVPNTVDITLIGRKSDLYLAKQLGNHEVVLDLTDYEPRDEPYKVKLTYNQSIDSLSYKLDPSTVSVTIKKKVSALKSITYDLLNQDSLDNKLSVTSVELAKSEVVVKGSQDALDKIANVKALVDLSNEEFTTKGTYNVDNVSLVAYDETGSILNNVEIVPSTVSATIILDTYSQKVPVTILTTGELVAGKAISSISINGQDSYSVEIYGEQTAIESIASVPVTINIADQGNTASKTYNVTMSKPTGVRYISDQSATIVVNFGEEKQTTVDGVKINSSKGLSSGLVVNAKSTEDSTVSVQVKGVESVINSITADNISAYLDLTGYTAGSYDNVPVYIEATDPRVQYIASKNVSIIISSK